MSPPGRKTNPPSISPVSCYALCVQRAEQIAGVYSVGCVGVSQRLPALAGTRVETRARRDGAPPPEGGAGGPRGRGRAGNLGDSKCEVCVCVLLNVFVVWAFRIRLGQSFTASGREVVGRYFIFKLLFRAHMCHVSPPRASQERSSARSTEKRNPLSPCATKTRERAAGANSAARRGRPEEKRGRPSAGFRDKTAVHGPEVASRRQPLRKVGSVHLVDRREVEAEAVVAQLDVLIDGVLALGVRVLRDLAPLAVVHRLW